MYDLERLLEELLETDASPGTLHLVLSKIKDRGRTSLVIQQCRKALNLHPNHDGLRTLLAEAYLDEGLAARASEELERVTRGLDESARAYKLLSDAFARQGRDAEASRCLDLYLAHHPNHAEAGEARPGDELPEEPGAFPDETIPEIATPTLAELYYSQGQIDAAVETYEKILSRSPDDPRARARLRELKSSRAAAPDEAGFEPEQAETAPAEELEPASPDEAALETEPGEAAPVEELAFEGGPDAHEEAAAGSKKRKSQRMIAVLEEWLTRIHETRNSTSV